MSELQIETRDVADAGVTVLALSGTLDRTGTPALERQLQELTERGRLRVVVSCAGLQRLSSDGMGVFLSHLIKIRKQGGDIRFCAMSDEVRSVLSLLGLGKLLVVCDSEEEAIGGFAGAADEQPQDGEKLRISVATEGEVEVVGLHGFVDRHTIGSLDETLSRLLERGRSKVVIDCAELSYISSNGMGVFISYVSKARAQGGDIRLCNMRDIARTVITMLGLHRLFEVFESRTEAVESYG